MYYPIKPHVVSELSIVSEFRSTSEYSKRKRCHYPNLNQRNLSSLDTLRVLEFYIEYLEHVVLSLLNERENEENPVVCCPTDHSSFRDKSFGPFCVRQAIEKARYERMKLTESEIRMVNSGYGEHLI